MAPRPKHWLFAAVLVPIVGLGALAAQQAASARAELTPAATPSPQDWPDDRITISNLGHATLLMNFLGARVITDPALCDRVGLAVGPFFTIGPQRLIAPPLKPPQLQSVQVVLITHAHMDHLDLPSLRALPKRAVIIACRGCGDLIRPLGFHKVRELKWRESTEVDGLTITAMPARHWGKRWPPFGRTYGFNSYVIEKEGHRMLIACDSAATDLFNVLHNHPLDIAVFSNGAYDPWIWNHANPEQVWRMFGETGARYLIPIHWGTFRLSKEPTDEPMRRLLAAAGADTDRIPLRQIGETWTMPMSSHFTTPEDVRRDSLR
jgi:L-ascorbate metabolism protein UlaG (beta-lactamase superfamily)